MTQRLISLGSLVLSCALFACGGGDKPSSAPSEPAAKTAVAPSPAPAAEPAATREGQTAVPAGPSVAATAPAISDDDARALIASWLAAQNEGDYARYAALYAARFTGVRRTGDKTRSFDQGGWLADRRRMFAKPMQVKAGEPRISQAGATAVVRFEQEWSTATYRDVGPKQMVLVREPGGVRIAREELLSSSALPAGGSSARFVTKVGGRSYVVLEPMAADVQRGKLIAVEVGSPSAAVFERAGADPASASAWRGGPLQLIGASGSCQTQAGAVRLVAIGYPHFGVIQTWNGGEGEPAVPHAKIAEEIAGMYTTWLALELEHPCTQAPVLALPAGAPAARVIAERPADAALSARAQAAFAALPVVKKLPAEERSELLGEVQVRAFGEHGEWVAAFASTSCAYGVEQLALFHADGEQLEPQLITRSPWSIWALLDLDGDNQPELVGTPWAPDAWLLIETRNGKVLQRADMPYNDCPC